MTSHQVNEFKYNVFDCFKKIKKDLADLNPETIIFYQSSLSDLQDLITIFNKFTIKETKNESSLENSLNICLKPHITKYFSLAVYLKDLSDYLKKSYFHIFEPSYVKLSEFLTITENIYECACSIIHSLLTLEKILETLKTKLNKDLTGIQITENFKVILKNYFLIFQEIDSLLEHSLIIYTKLQNNYENLNYIYDQFEFDIEFNVERDFIENHENTIGQFIATNKLFNLNIQPNRVFINLKKTIGHLFARSEIFVHELINYKLVIADALKREPNNRHNIPSLSQFYFSYFSNFYDLYNLKNEIIYNISIKKIEMNDFLYENHISPFKIFNDQIITPFEMIQTYAANHRENYFSKSFRSKFKKLIDCKDNRFLVEKIVEEFMNLDLDKRTRIIYLFDYLNQ